MDDFLGTDGHGFKKGTAWLRDGNGLISLKAIQSIDTAGLRIGLRTKHTKP